MMIPSTCLGASPDSAGLPIRPTAIAGYPIAGPPGGIPDPGGELGQEAGNRHGRSSWREPLRAGPAPGAAGIAHRTADRHHQQLRALKISFEHKVWLPLESLQKPSLERFWSAFGGQETSQRIPSGARRPPKGYF